MTLTPVEAESVACGETNPGENEPLSEPVPPLAPPPAADRVLVIRLGAVRFLSEGPTAAGGGSVYKINPQGKIAFEGLVRGQPLP